MWCHHCPIAKNHLIFPNELKQSWCTCTNNNELLWCFSLISISHICSHPFFHNISCCYFIWCLFFFSLSDTLDNQQSCTICTVTFFAAQNFASSKTSKLLISSIWNVQWARISQQLFFHFLLKVHFFSRSHELFIFFCAHLTNWNH